MIYIYCSISVPYSFRIMNNFSSRVSRVVWEGAKKTDALQTGFVNRFVPEMYLMIVSAETKKQCFLRGRDRK